MRITVRGLITAAFKDLQVELNERFVAVLAELSGYDYNFIYDRFMEVMNEDGDIGSFVNITLEHDW